MDDKHNVLSSSVDIETHIIEFVEHLVKLVKCWAKCVADAKEIANKGAFSAGLDRAFAEGIVCNLGDGDSHTIDVYDAENVKKSAANVAETADNVATAYKTAIYAVERANEAVNAIAIIVKKDKKYTDLFNVANDYAKQASLDAKTIHTYACKTANDSKTSTSYAIKAYSLTKDRTKC